MSETETTSPRRAATRERLVKAAMQVFGRRGVLGSSVEEICEAAGFTRGAFYSNFASRDELCIAVLHAQCEFYLAAARKAVEELDQPSGTVDGLIDNAIGVFMAAVTDDADQILAMNELRLYAAREPEIRQAFLDVDARLSPAFDRMIRGGLERFGLDLTLTPEQVIGLLHAVYDQTALDQLIIGESPNSPLVGERLALVLRTLVLPRS
ncbi:TetR/AcrR family transcriptional regulator [Luteococcus sanguinis]|uniref:TetR/AcrR family transcriptional regulator n=1 Tax=Luteococcus sanguinis TaxID=174038 RepID=A0ABW1X1W0_9ACTN